MALIKCKYCGEPVSDRAAACPHCGKDLRQETPQLEHQQIAKQPEPESQTVPQQPQQIEEQENASSGGIISNLLIIFITLVGGCLTVLPLFGIVYEFGYSYKPFFCLGAAPITYFVVGFAGLGVLACLGIIISRIIQLSKSRRLSQKAAIWSTAISIIVPLCTFFLINYSFKSFYNLYWEKTEKADGIFKFEYHGKTYFFCVDVHNIANQDNLCVSKTDVYMNCDAVKPKTYCLVDNNGDLGEGYISNVFYNFNDGMLMFDLDFNDGKLQQGGSLPSYADAIYARAEVDMHYVHIDNQTFLLEKISNNATKEELGRILAEEAAAEAARKLEEFKSFQSLDLTAFMLHGRVKKVEGWNDTMFFDKNGRLTRYIDAWGDTEIEHRDDGVDIHSDGSASFSITVRDGKIAEEHGDVHQGYLETSFFSDYDENNCPTKVTFVTTCAYEDGEREVGRSTHVIKYSNYDEYGNWTRRNCWAHEGDYVRKITYYPIEK